MTKPPKLRYVDWQRGRGGVTWYPYFRDSGIRCPLPKYDTPEFWVEYGRRLSEKEARTRPEAPQGYLPGSFGALITDYFASPEFQNTKPNTQKLYRLILEPLGEHHGRKAVATLERKHIEKWQRERAETPGTANMLVKVMKLILSFAVEREYRKDNPARRIKLYKLGEHRAWTADECAAFEALWPEGSMERRAYMLAKCTGQRCGDLAAMSRAHRKGGEIRVVQEKTGVELWIQELSELTAELARGAQHMSLLTTPAGAAFTSEKLSLWFASAIEQAGLPDDVVLHGLRKTAAVIMVEAGVPHLQAMAVTGHRSLQVFQQYTKGADQRTLMRAAIRTVERNTKRTKTAKRPLTQTAKQSKGA